MSLRLLLVVPRPLGAAMVPLVSALGRSLTRVIDKFDGGGLVYRPGLWHDLRVERREGAGVSAPSHDKERHPLYVA